MVVAARHDRHRGVAPLGGPGGIGGVAQRGHVLDGPGRGQHVAHPVQHGHPHAQQPGDLGRHLAQPAPGEHDLDQRPVRLLRPGQHGGLAVEDVGQHLVEDVVEADVVGKLDQREAEPVGLLHHLLGQLVEIAAELDGERGQAALVEVGHQPAERLGRVAQRVTGGEQQLVRLDPGQDVGHLHHVEALHDAVQAPFPRDQPGSRQCRDAEDLADGDAVNDRSGARRAHGGSMR